MRRINYTYNDNISDKMNQLKKNSYHIISDKSKIKHAILLFQQENLIILYLYKLIKYDIFNELI